MAALEAVGEDESSDDENAAMDGEEDNERSLAGCVEEVPDRITGTDVIDKRRRLRNRKRGRT